METQLKEDGAVSSHMPYSRRSGTKDSGKEYEFKMLTLLALRCAVQDSEDIRLATNADGVGDFDDIILCNSSITYFIQLKHKDKPNSITKAELSSEKGDFSLLKYAKSFTELTNSIQDNSTKSVVKHLNANSMLFILFTNRGITNNNELLEPDSSDYSFLSTSMDTAGNVHKFKLEKFQGLSNSEYCQNIRLFSSQIHVNRIDNLIIKEVEKVVGHYGLEKVNATDIAAKFTLYITNWAKGNLGGNYCLTKQAILFKISELCFCQYELDLRNERPFHDGPRKNIWNIISKNKFITVVNSDYTVSTFLKQYISSEVKQYLNEYGETWTTNLTDLVKNSFYEIHTDLKTQMLTIIGNHGHITFLDTYKCLWFHNKLPLLLKVRSIEDYENITRILKMSNYNFRIIVINKSVELLNSIDSATCFVTLQDLNPKERVKILKQTIKFQGRPIKLRRLVDKSMYEHISCSDIIHILSGDFNIGNYYKPLPEYFIDRSLWRVLVEPELLSNIKDDIFLLQDASIDSFNGLPVCKLEEIDFTAKDGCNIVALRGSENLQQIENLKSRGKVIHRLRFHENYLEWIESFGSIEHIRRYLVFQQHHFPESILLQDEMFHTSQNTVFWIYVKNILVEEKYLLNTTHVINASPGMGKSTLLDFLALKAPPDLWVLRINLNEHDEYFECIKQNNSNLTAISVLTYFNDAILEKFNCTNIQLAKAIFRKMLTAKQVLVLLDGFDEISHKDEVTQIAKCLHDEKYHMWITTRPVMGYYLEEALNTIATTLSPLTKRDQKNFLIKYFSQGYATVSLNLRDCQLDINQFVNELLDATSFSFDDRKNEFTGLPLHIKMLADVVGVESTLFFNSSKEKLDLLYLYEQFVKRKNDIFYNKFGRAARDIHSLLEEHQKLFALKDLFHIDDALQLNIDKKLEEYYKDRSKRELLQREGFIVVFESTNVIKNNFSIRFVHRRFAEYLAAQWLAENFDSKDEATKNTANILIARRFKSYGIKQALSGEIQQYKFLFTVFDRMVARERSLHLDVISGHVHKIAEMAKSHPECILEVDRCGRSVLHVIGLYSVNSSAGSRTQNIGNILLGIIEHIPSDVISSIKDDIFGHSPLYYAIAISSLSIANKICEKTNKFTITNCIPTSFKHAYFEHCAMAGYNSLFKILLPHFSIRDVLSRNVYRESTVLTYCRFTEDKNVPEKFLLQFVGEIGNTTISELLKLNDRCEDLRLAAAFGSNANLRVCLRTKGADIEKSDIDGNTAFHYAIIHGRLETVKIMLDNGAEINKPGNNNNTVLHFAAKTGNEDIILELLSKGAEINKLNSTGETCLHFALNWQRINTAKLLLFKGVDYNVADTNGVTALHYAAALGADDIVSLLVSKGVDVNKTSKNNQTPLYMAVNFRRKDTVKLLLSYGASCNIQRIIGLFQREHEILPNDVGDGKLNNIDIIQYREKQSIPVINRFIVPLLHAATIGGDLDIVNALLSYGADCNIKDSNGKSSLHCAIHKGFSSIVSQFLSTNCNVNMQDIDGNTPLHSALTEGHKKIAKLILPKHQDVNIENNNGISPLHYAVEKGHNGIVKKLLLRGANINKMNKNDEDTPLHIAVQLRHTRTVKLLLSKGAEVNVQNRYGDSPLHYAALLGDSDILSQLVSKGADVGKKNVTHSTPLHYAMGHSLINRNIVNFSRTSMALTYYNSTSKNILNKTSPSYHFGYFLKNLNPECQKSTVQILLDKGAEVNAKDIIGSTALHYASIAVPSRYRTSSLFQGNAEALTNAINFYQDSAVLLLGKGADFNIRNQQGQTCIDLAARVGSLEMVNILKFFAGQLPQES